MVTSIEKTFNEPTTHISLVYVEIQENLRVNYTTLCRQWTVQKPTQIDHQKPKSSSTVYIANLPHARPTDQTPALVGGVKGKHRLHNDVRKKAVKGRDSTYRGV